MKRRCLDTLALRALMKATHLLGLALAERLRQYRDSGDRALDRFAGFPGDRSVALHLGRVGWELSRRTVQRIRHERPVLPPTAPPIEQPRVVRARYPHHVWMLDLTEIPGFLRLFSFKLAVILDVFSRAPLAARVFHQEPTGRDMARFVIRTARRLGPPRHSVSDQAAQFKSGPFLAALARLGTRHRYGAIGRTGSIALIERFFRTLKTITGLHWRPPLLRRDLERRLALAFLYYLWLRPHQGLAGATPGEVYLGPKRSPTGVPPARGRPGEQRLPVSLVPEIRYLDPEGCLPYLHSAAPPQPNATEPRVES